MRSRRVASIRCDTPDAPRPSRIVAGCFRRGTGNVYGVYSNLFRLVAHSAGLKRRHRRAENSNLFQIVR